MATLGPIKQSLPIFAVSSMMALPWMWGPSARAAGLRLRSAARCSPRPAERKREGRGRWQDQSTRADAGRAFAPFFPAGLPTQAPARTREVVLGLPHIHPVPLQLHGKQLAVPCHSREHLQAGWCDQQHQATTGVECARGGTRAAAISIGAGPQAGTGAGRWVRVVPSCCHADMAPRQQRQHAPPSRWRWGAARCGPGLRGSGSRCPR